MNIDLSLRPLRSSTAPLRTDLLSPAEVEGSGVNGGGIILCLMVAGNGGEKEARK